MNRSSYSLLGKVVVATAGLAIATSGASSAEALAAKVRDTTENLAVQMLLADKPAKNEGMSQGQEKPKSTEETQQAELPDKVRDAVLKDASGRTQMKISELRVVQASKQTWPDGCLGLGEENASCSQATVPGWVVLIGAEQKFWVYRADQSGSLVKWDEDASKTVTALRATQTSGQRRLTTRTTQTTQASTRRAETAVRRGTENREMPVRRETSTQQAAVSRETSNQETAVRRETSTQQAAVSQETRTSFKDISKSYWARDFIGELAQKKIILGYPDGSYRPNQQVTRAEFAAMLSLAFPQANRREEITFKDVSTSSWTHSYILEAYQRGFLDVDPNNNFNPDENITRLDVLVALARGLNYTANGSTNALLATYNDASAIPESLRTLVAAATERGVVVNYPNVKLLKPNKAATRAEVAAILHQAMVSNGQAQNVSSPYVVTAKEKKGSEARQAESREDEGKARVRRNCNQGIGNGSEGCDPGNSSPRGGSNDEGGRTPGNRPDGKR